MVTIINKFSQGQTQHTKNTEPFQNQEHEKDTTEITIPTSKVENRYSKNKDH